MLQIHKPNDYNQNLINTFNKISIGRKYKIIGSSILKHTKYFNDYDLNNYFKGNSTNILNKITNHFKTLFKESYKNLNTWITDFKMGIDPNYNKDEDEYKLRWSKSDIIQGFKILRDGTKKYFKECILDKTMMKLDYILLLNGIFVEISENYEISIDGKTNIVTKNNLKEELQNEVDKYKFINKFKSLKREFSLLKLEGKNQKKIKRYEDIFNSDLGYMNNIINNLNTLLLMIEQDFRPVNFKEIFNNLQIIKQNLSFFFIKNFSNEIDEICKNKTRNKIHQTLDHIVNYLTNYLNKELKKIKI
jgi:hypothetical protein